jgi:hypothetical protein
MDRKALLERFVATWHARDVDGITAMLAPGFEYRRFRLSCGCWWGAKGLHPCVGRAV